MTDSTAGKPLPECIEILSDLMKRKAEYERDIEQMTAPHEAAIADVMEEYQPILDDFASSIQSYRDVIQNDMAISGVKSLRPQHGLTCYFADQRKTVVDDLQALKQHLIESGLIESFIKIDSAKVIRELGPDTPGLKTITTSVFTVRPEKEPTE